jgi:ketosteroid isomerase-like protein
MKNFFLLAAFLFAAFNTQAQDITPEMMTLANNWKAALERGDAKALAAMYAEKMDYVNPDGTTSTATRAEIEADFIKTFETHTGTLELAPGCTATLLPDSRANFKGEFTQTSTDKKTGKKEAFNGYFDQHWVREGGQWKLSVVKVTPKAQGKE